MSKRKNIIRIDNTVRLLVPRTFVRCDYPLGMDEARAMVLGPAVATTKWDRYFGPGPTYENVPKMEEFLRSVGITNWTEPAFDNFVTKLAYLMRGAKRMGGRERTLHMKWDWPLGGEKFTVINTFMVRTGTYYSPSGGMDDDGGWYEPGGLKNATSHKILNCWGESGEVCLLEKDCRKESP